MIKDQTKKESRKPFLLTPYNTCASVILSNITNEYFCDVWHHPVKGRCSAYVSRVVAEAGKQFGMSESMSRLRK